MLGSLEVVLLTAAVGIGPFGYGAGGCSTCASGYGYGGAMPADAYYGGMATVGAYPSMGAAYGSGSSMDQLYPYDAPDPWMHGYFQSMPAYGGFRYFRPYNYKHALAQSQTAGQWGISPAMPYSQQFWHRYQDKASLNPNVAQQNTAANYSAEYTRELARLRALQDFQASQARSAYGVQPAGVQPLSAAPNYNMAPAQPAGVMPSTGVYPSSPGGAAPSPVSNIGANWPAQPGPQWPGAAATYPQSMDPRYQSASSRVIDLPPPPARLNPPAYQNAAQVEQLQQQLQEQSRQIQVLQNALNQNSYQPPQLNAPSNGWNTPYGY